MNTRIPYIVTFDALGLYCERASAADVLVNEIDGGYLVSYVTQQEQHVETLDSAEMARLQLEAQRSKSRPYPSPRARLRAVGRYLDRRKALAAVVQESANGYSVEFTGLPIGDDLSRLVRLHEPLDEKKIATLAQ